MASTYSPSLRLELIGDGDQPGNWGRSTNVNLGTLVEGAIAGYATVSVTSANQALTASNGAADQARLAVIQLTTTTTANFAVYAPPASKQYTIYNNTNYTATIYNSTVLGNTTAAGVGVAIPAGKTMTVWSDGTNFRVRNSHLVGTVVGNVTGNITGNANSADQVNHVITFNSSGSGAASGVTFSGYTAQTISYNTIGAPSVTGTNATGTWGINISGSAASATSGVTQSNGDNSTNLATTAFVQNMGLGWNQTWQSFTSLIRQTNASFTWASLANKYTNSTGKPICVSIGRNGNNGYRTTVWVDGVAVCDATVDQYGGGEAIGPIVVPNGAVYAVSVSNGSWCNYWVELR